MTAEDILKRLEKLKSERASWASYWQEIASLILPKKAFITKERTSGNELDFTKIYDNTPIRSLHTMASGFHSHLTNPSSKWFVLGMTDRKLMDSRDVKIWLKDAEDEIFNTFNSSNFDQTMQEFYQDAGAFGTGPIFLEEDLIDRIRFTSLPLAEVYIEEDSRGRVNRLYREFEYTAAQAFEKWDKNAGEETMHAIEANDYLKKIKFVHAIYPREKREEGKVDNKNLPWASMWIESKNKRTISEGGFHEFPAMVGRFNKITGEVWGFSPAMDNMADIRMLNAMMKILLRASQKIVDPPFILPSKGFILPFNLNAAGVNYHDGQKGTMEGYKAIDTHAQIPIGFEIITDVRNAIKEGFFVPLFNAFAQITKQMTVPEVNQRIREGLALLGPVVGRFMQEVLDPIIIRTFFILYRGGYLREPPAELQGKEFIVQYISPLAKAQREAEVGSLTRAMALVGEISKFVPPVLDKLDGDKAVDEIWEITGANPKILRDDTEVEQIRAMRMQQQQQAAEAEALKLKAGAAKDVTQAGKNVVEAGVQ